MYPHVLVVHHRIGRLLIDDVCRQVTGTFLGFGDDRVEVDLEVEEVDCWGPRVTVVGEFVATHC